LLMDQHAVASTRTTDFRFIRSKHPSWRQSDCQGRCEKDVPPPPRELGSHQKNVRKAFSMDRLRVLRDFPTRFGKSSSWQLMNGRSMRWLREVHGWLDRK